MNPELASYLSHEAVIFAMPTLALIGTYYFWHGIVYLHMASSESARRKLQWKTGERTTAHQEREVGHHKLNVAGILIMIPASFAVFNLIQYRLNPQSLQFPIQIEILRDVAVAYTLILILASIASLALAIKIYTMGLNYMANRQLRGTFIFAALAVIVWLEG